MDGTTRLPGVPPGVGIQVEDRPRAACSEAIVTGHSAFEAMAAEWDDLWARTPSATPFQAHAWASAWAGAYVEPGDLVVVTVRDGDVLVAGAALHRMRRGFVRLLVPLGGEISDHSDVLLDPSVPDAGRRLVEALLRVPGWRVLDLPEVLPHGAAQLWAQEWPGSVRRSESSVNLQVPVLPVADALTRLPTKTAATLRRKLRKVEQLGVQRSEVPPADVPRAVEDLIRLHEDQWQGRRGNPEHLVDRFRDHLRNALAPMIARGQAVVVEYRVDGELLASEVDLIGHERLDYYLAGISTTLRQRIDTAVLLVSSALERARQLDKKDYSFLRGTEDYKFRWRPNEVVATRIMLARPGPLRSAGYFLATAAWQAAQSTARRVLQGRARDVARAVMHGMRTLRARR